MPRQPGIESVFLTGAGRTLPKRTVHNTFERLRRRLGWVARGGHPHPRIHDLRHTFICQALLRGRQDNRLDRVAGAIPATPVLMNEASQRFCRFCGGDSQ